MSSILSILLARKGVSWVVSGKESPTAKQGRWVQSLGWEDLEKEMAHSAFLWNTHGARGAWRSTVHGVTEESNTTGSKQQQLEKLTFFSIQFYVGRVKETKIKLLRLNLCNISLFAKIFVALYSVWAEYEDSERERL